MLHLTVLSFLRSQHYVITSHSSHYTHYHFYIANLISYSSHSSYYTHHRFYTANITSLHHIHPIHHIALHYTLMAFITLFILLYSSLSFIHSFIHSFMTCLSLYFSSCKTKQKYSCFPSFFISHILISFLA